MKQFFVLMLLVVAAFSYQAVASDAAESVDTVVSMEEERYVIVYKQNGVVHAVIINHHVDCEALYALNPENATILDCGPLNSVVPPTGTTNVDEAQALSDLGLEEWPM